MTCRPTSPAPALPSAPAPTRPPAPALPGLGLPFERVRRITGYLVGGLARFNNAKLAEVRDRLPHSAATADALTAGHNAPACRVPGSGGGHGRC